MEIPKQQIVSMIEARFGGDRAQQAADRLPDPVDPTEHADLLNELGVDPHATLQQAGGSAGGIAGSSGLGTPDPDVSA